MFGEHHGRLEGGITEGQEETFEGNACIHYLKSDDDFMVVYICQTSNCTFSIVAVNVCQLNLNKAVKKQTYIQIIAGNQGSLG